MSNHNKTGILLVNLGTPQSPTAQDVRVYLAEFLSDKRIVNLPAWFWKLILHGIILRTRPAKSAAKYAKIWLPTGSPLMVYSRALCNALSQELEMVHDTCYVPKLAMRYGEPSIGSILDEFMAEGIKKILVLPLYPQYSSTTTASALDAIYLWSLKQHFIPEFRFVNDYHDKASYIDALGSSIEQSWKQYGRSEKLVISFHGIPQQLIDDGDPYQKQCSLTADLLVKRLGLQEGEYCVTYQSRFGKSKWLEPATQDTLERLAREQINSVDVVCPGFAVDCLETLEEIEMECQEAFLENGGESFRYIPCLNADSSLVSVLCEIVTDHSKHWNI